MPSDQAQGRGQVTESDGRGPFQLVPCGVLLEFPAELIQNHVTWQGVFNRCCPHRGPGTWNAKRVLGLCVVDICPPRLRKKTQGFLRFLLMGIGWQSFDLRDRDPWSPVGGGHMLRLGAQTGCFWDRSSSLVSPLPGPAHHFRSPDTWSLAALL